MLYFYLFFKFLNKIRVKYLEESGVEREGELEGGDLYFVVIGDIVIGGRRVVV